VGSKRHATHSIQVVELRKAGEAEGIVKNIQVGTNVGITQNESQPSGFGGVPVLHGSSAGSKKKTMKLFENICVPGNGVGGKILNERQKDNAAVARGH